MVVNCTQDLDLGNWENHELCHCFSGIFLQVSLENPEYHVRLGYIFFFITYISITELNELQHSEIRHLPDQYLPSSFFTPCKDGDCGAWVLV